jgi:hypothetical protein
MNPKIMARNEKISRTSPRIRLYRIETPMRTRKNISRLFIFPIYTAGKGIIQTKFDGLAKSPSVPLGAGLRFNFVVAARP